MSDRPTIAIVGGGVSGALTAIHLARSGKPLEIRLIDRAGAFARGVAYSTTSNAHLLNVPAARMSALHQEPGHFISWARRRLGESLPDDAFLPRPLYGDYIAELLDAASASGGPASIERISKAVIDLSPGEPARLTFADGSAIAADRVVCALGHTPPIDPPVRFGSAFYRSPRYHPNPWSPGMLEQIEDGDSVLLIGVGLTMYDVALSLRERGHRGAIHAFSRRGLAPRSHAPRPLDVSGGPAAEAWLRVEPTAKSLLKAVRRACDATAECGDWRAVIDSIRPVTAQIWKRLPHTEQARFNAKLRSFWDVHRHRAAGAVHRAIVSLIEGHQLHLHAGRLHGWITDSDLVEAHTSAGPLRVRHVVNCTGPDSDINRSADPFVRALLQRGLIVRDHLGLGAATAPDGAIIDSTGRASSWLSAIGPWRRAELWESIAVPELRVQAAELAARLTHFDHRPHHSEGHRRADAPLPSISD